MFRLNKHDKTLNLMPWNKMAHGTGSGWRGWTWGWGVLFQLGVKQSHFHTQHRRHCMWQNVFTPICHRQHGLSSGRCSQVTWETGRRATKRLAKVTPTQGPILFNGVAHLAHMHLPPHYAAHRAACTVVSLPIMSLELFFFFFSRQIKSSWLQNVQKENVWELVSPVSHFTVFFLHRGLWGKMLFWLRGIFDCSTSSGHREKWYVSRVSSSYNIQSSIPSQVTPKCSTKWGCAWINP